ncbi:nucleotide sugar dehydrogenase [Clostridium perfringens]|uniref:nucleotide sugar dehydrogenase n=1 Tax=Clostridium perfringens TaxID=1502 RepID=UPI0024BD4F98|nr:nucleotide sugar dehydrogenase [Clostridium perfringens]EJT5933922.1 nucleotide sugar dehydrogenase [Clostridium perfringens]MDM0876775.1 nucleotide sugar dehydrogenase [Clostridium perfringens]MDM0893466.1 nucleotide sugar dehydrogenase [Clostridium perfringens]HEE9817758.1 nucleotide sugar dehydrogenase [Clostridium perfringens]HEO1700356.1 nucleotide sugar dehydrogenase [Clostridium perfringens]
MNKRKISIVGLGYVGMPLAVAFAKKVEVIGFDINKAKIECYKNGKDITNEVGDEAIKKTTVKFTFDEKELKECNFHIVAVPTPINGDKTPDLNPVIGATEVVGRNLSKGSIVVFESTVYPGVTEDICVPILEKESGLKCGKDFKVGYSPERINPGDKVHRLETIMKIVSGMDEESLNVIADVYSLVIEAGVYKAESIKVAEAAKVIENSQRDVNIAFVNELSMIFNRMGIDTNAVLKAAGTKWNFLNFKPGLVGGHCIGVDPYYLTYRGSQLGYKSQIIAAGRRVNDGMGKYVADEIVKGLIKNDKKVKGSKVGILGITFKEDCPDVRNTKVIDIIEELKTFGVECIINDCVADKNEVFREYGIELVDISELKDLDSIVIAVGHNQYKNKDLSEYIELFAAGEKLFVDVKGLFNKNDVEKYGVRYWSL